MNLELVRRPRPLMPRRPMTTTVIDGVEYFIPGLPSALPRAHRKPTAPTPLPKESGHPRLDVTW